MKNPLLPDPARHPMLYSREYRRIKNRLALPLFCLIAFPLGALVGAVAWLLFGLVFAL